MGSFAKSIDAIKLDIGKNIHIIIFFAFILLIITAPSFDLLSWASRYDEKRIAELGLLLFVSGWLSLSRHSINLFTQALFSIPKLSRYLLGLILLLGLSSSMLAPEPIFAFREVALFTLLLVFCISVAMLYREHRSPLIMLFTTGILCSAFIYEIKFFSAYIGSFIQQNPLLWPEPFSNFSSVRFLNQFQIWTLPLITLPLLLYRKHLNTTALELIVIVITAWWIIVFTSRSRGMTIAISASALLTLVLYRKDAWPLLRIMGITALLGLALYWLLFFFLLETSTEISAGKVFTDQARVILWKSTLDMIWENPLFGVGPGHYAWYPNEIAAHPHNSALQIAAEWGLPVALLCTGLLIWGGIAWYRKFNAHKQHLSSNENQMWIALFTSATAGLLYSMVSGVIVMPLSQLMMAAVLGLMLGVYHADKQTVNQSKVFVSLINRGFVMGIALLL
jgi:O-antigen ligase